MSTSGFEGLIIIILHGLFIIISLTLLHYTIIKTGKTKKVLCLSFIVVTTLYIIWVTTKDNWKREIEKTFVGNYELKKYKDCINCKIELRQDNTYRIYDTSKDFENGSWKYFDDGDISFVEFDNGGQFGFNEYEYKKK